MRVLVTGGSGFIGRHLIPRLIELGHTVAILELPTAGVPAKPIYPGFELSSHTSIHYADLRNFSLTVRAIRDAEPDRIVHLAAAGVTDPFLDPNAAIRHNVYGTLNLLRASFQSVQIEKRPEQVIVARTPGEHSALNVYAASKAAAWNFCQMYARTSGWPVNGVMIFQAYGPDQPKHTLVQAAIKAAKAGETFPMTSGSQQRDWIYISDVVEGFIATLNVGLEPGSTVELGTGEATSVADVVRKIFQMTGSDGKQLPGVLPDRPGETALQLADVDHTTELINWQAIVSLDVGLGLIIDRA